MIFHQTPLADAWLIELKVIADERGWFTRMFCKQVFQERGLVSEFVQINHSQCIQSGTLRGLHYQTAPSAEVKLVRCVRGQIFDVMVDVRKDSPTFLQWYGEVLSASNGRMLYIPQGFAHAYQAIEAGSEVIYQASSAYAPHREQRIRFDEPRVGIEWPLADVKLSPKDESTSYLTDAFEGVSL